MPYLPVLASWDHSGQHCDDSNSTLLSLTWVKLKEMPTMPLCIQARIACVVQSEFVLTLQNAETVQKLSVCHGN